MIIIAQVMAHPNIFARKPEVVAKDLLGRYLVRKVPGSGILTATIAGVGAYSGDLGQPSRAGMNYAPGEIFMMSYRGLHMLNVATERSGVPSCVEIRAVRFGEELVEGSARIANRLKIDQSVDGKYFEKVFRLGDKPVVRIQVKKEKGKSDNCVGFFSL